MEEEWQRAKEEGLFNYIFPPNSCEKGKMEERTTKIETERRMCKELYNAARDGNLAVLDELHNKKSDILCCSTPYGNTALHRAAFYGRLCFVMNFIELCKADIEAWSVVLKARNEEGNTALHEACGGGNDRVVSVLLDADEELAGTRNKDGETALFKAVENGHYRIVKLLLPRTPDDCFKRDNGDTALHVAVTKLNKDIVRLLLKVKPELAEEVDGHERTALHMASSTTLSRWECTWKSSVHDSDTMLILTNRSACYRKDKYGRTPLHRAISEGNADLTEEILKYEPACIEIPDADGRTALHLAVRFALKIYDQNSSDLRRIMVSLTDPDLINRTDKSHQTALGIARKRAAEDRQLYRAIEEYLLSRGALALPGQTGPEEDKDKDAIEARKEEKTAASIAISISLISTVAFAVAITPPNTGDSFGDHFCLHLLLIADTIAFCYSLGVALILVYIRDSSLFHKLLADIFAAISVAAASLAITFGAGIQLVAGTSNWWLAVIVWGMVLTMIYVAIIKSEEKVFLFRAKWKKMLEVIAFPPRYLANYLPARLLPILDDVFK